MVDVVLVLRQRRGGDEDGWRFQFAGLAGAALADLEQVAQQVEELSAQLKGIIEQMGGKGAKVEQWGVKSLSFRLRKNRKAHFTLFNLDAPSAAINEIVRTKDMTASLAKQGLVVSGGGPDLLRDLIVKDRVKWAKVIADAGITAE